MVYHGLRAHEGWQLKSYRVAYDPADIDRMQLEGGVSRALAMLPAPAVEVGRPGAGVLILHAGRGADYVVLGWWDRQNELPLRVVIRDHAAPSVWRPAGDSESVCVWDLQILGAERDLYVSTVLAGGEVREGVERYLGRSALRGDDRLAERAEERPLDRSRA